MSSRRSLYLRRLCCAAPTADGEGANQAPSKALLCLHKSRPLIDGKFAPLDQTMLFIIGQDLETVRGFLQTAFANPSGTTSYTRLDNTRSSLHGLETAVDYGSGIVHAKEQLKLIPNGVVALGVCLTGALEDIVEQRCDGSIDRLASWVRSQSRPVFLRLGYEFDGPWNAYEPELYKRAFKIIVLRLRSLGVQNFVSVWQSCTYKAPPVCGQKGTPPVVTRSFTDWYPGDDFVDWMGTSYFVFDKQVHDSFLNFARGKGKPVMIAESAPQGYDLEDGMLVDHYTNDCLIAGLTGREIWKQWYKPYFKYISDNRDVIRAVAYINTKWKEQPMWNCGDNGYWGDSRIQVGHLVGNWEFYNFLLHRSMIT